LPASAVGTKTGDPNQLDDLAAGPATFHMSDVLDCIANFALDRGKRQTGIGLERKPSQAI